MLIRRIDSFNDHRIKPEVLHQHGAFLLDNKYICEFLIISPDSAIIYYHNYSYIDNIINEFRFYAKHICKFYTSSGRLIRQYNDINLYETNIDLLQPSQFYIDVDKLSNIYLWSKANEYFSIPVCRYNDNIVILDGHTRLYYAYKLNLSKVYVYEEPLTKQICDFVDEAKKRNIFSIKDLKLLPHDEYDKLWYDYCDSYNDTHGTNDM